MEKPRPAIVTVLGHVDHGKTSLLDAIRKTNLVVREAGGITQSIGASQVITKDGKTITFIDTPGHAAFTQMRSQGAMVADIALLVVAADDGVKPQTKEAITHIISAAIPFVVVITKVDLPSASPETVIGQLEKEGVLFEGRGGSIPYLEVSAKTGKGIEDLLGLITLIAEVNGVNGDRDAKLEAVVIETSKNKRGMLVSVVIRNGTLKVADNLFTKNASGKVKSLFNWLGRPVKEAIPGEPIQILGFEELPAVGSQLSTSKEEIIESDKSTKEVAVKTDKNGIKVIIKAATLGSLEAILANTPPGIFILESGVGEPTQSDVFRAKNSNSTIYAFEVKVPQNVDKLAKTEGVIVRSFKIIYELFEALEKLIKEGKDEVRGKAEVLAVFPYNDKKVAGCKVKEGIITKADKVKFVRGDSEIGTAKVVSIRRGKNEINEARVGEECGILIEPQLDFTMGDMLISVAS